MQWVPKQRKNAFKLQLLEKAETVEANPLVEFQYCTTTPDPARVSYCPILHHYSSSGQGVLLSNTAPLLLFPLGCPTVQYCATTPVAARVSYSPILQHYFSSG